MVDEAPRADAAGGVAVDIGLVGGSVSTHSLEQSVVPSAVACGGWGTVDAERPHGVWGGFWAAVAEALPAGIRTDRRSDLSRTAAGGQHDQRHSAGDWFFNKHCAGRDAWGGDVEAEVAG